ncbi:MAG: DUF3300 domain-containing protein [Terracidiphilus sp.]|jgi:hypothetical protein
MALLLPLAQGTLSAQYAPGQSSGYAQPQTYAQQPYAQQAYPDSGQGYAPQEYEQPQPPAQALSAEQLEQLVAPIALYPDALLAQILAAATYPAQVVGADHWLQAQGYASPDRIAAGADAQSWDPSVKALTAFPQVLALMDRDLQWTTDLGNAYYNQPQDVLQTVQVLRQRAQAAGTLQNTPQEAVSYNQGYIQLTPSDPQVVYVPAYNPWDVYGQPVAPYPGFSLLGSLGSFAGSAPVRFGMGIAMAAFNHSPFGWMSWALDWLSQSVLFHHANYSSQSTTVAHSDSPRGGPAGRYNRSQSSQPQTSYDRQDDGYRGARALVRQPVRPSEDYSGSRSFADSGRGYAPGSYVRPAWQNYAYNRPQPPVPMPVRPQQSYARPGYGSGFYGGAGQAYAGRPGSVYASPPQSWRAPAPSPQRGEFAQRGYSGDRSYSASPGRGFAESPAKPEHSGGFHLFGGGHNAEKSYGGGHAPKSYGGGKEFKEHSHGSSHSGGHHGDGPRR